MLPHSKPLKCPQCGMFDQVQKVSALVTAGASTTVVAGYDQRLSPPAEPRYISAWNAVTITGVVGLTFLALASLFSALLFLNLTAGQLPACVIGILLVTLWFALSVAHMAVPTWWKNKRMAEVWQAEYARWQVAMARWEALYYCLRDDVVFFPGSPSAISAASMRTVL
jgi:hypothetical protein